jgi:hypothetical protein
LNAIRIGGILGTWQIEKSRFSTLSHKGEADGTLHSLLAPGLGAGTEKGGGYEANQGGVWQHPFPNALYSVY